MSDARRITRRRVLAEALAGTVGASALAGAVAGCGGSPSASAAKSGSTLRTTWTDPVGDGQLRVGPGEPLLDRVELGARAAPSGVIATLAHITDAHVLDPSSPARVTFLDRLGAPFQSTFRPQETLTRQVLAGAAAAVRSMRPDLVIQGGDLIDNDQDNELTDALAVLRGGTVGAIGRRDGYRGVQARTDADPFYYRPAVDAPQHAGVLGAASRRFTCPGLRARWCPVLGDHDALVAGELVPTALTRSLAIGDRALWDLPQDVRRPSGVPLTVGPGASPDGPPQPLLVDQLLRQALAGPTVQVPADPARRELSFEEVIERLQRAAGALTQAAGVPGRLEDQLGAAADRWVLVVSHQPLASSENGEALLALLDQAPRVIATLAGHTHHNRIAPRTTARGGYWQITTGSLIDYPQQARALRVVATAGGGVAIHTWMLDHVFPGRLGTIARQLSFLDAQGGRPEGFAGGRLDRNVTLYRHAPR